jgi:hypothetical protein
MVVNKGMLEMIGSLLGDPDLSSDYDSFFA